MIWSPGLVFINNHQHHQHQNQNHQDQNIKNLNLDLPFNTPHLTPYSSSSASCWTTPTTQNHKINSKIADGLARLSEWEHVEQFPIDLIPIDPLRIPSGYPSNLSTYVTPHN
ncbi:hypothetical protein Pst134EA_032014 [Puccinia striiformis f. sp. tritici]|uniref:uncharacterized protein n=1 Tax=Puccinia striiformis f. sp. tritici TaxID=168172 RepID=UPI0020088EEB|nr:uncharacterized protein Pst134EA_032014 [Puccinia striiformis f. sp. tritici]KAH9444377.1 hypothetical protein Pst134EA_032014 [Puccinia striiformis f. sp. tritici]